MGLPRVGLIAARRLFERSWRPRWLPVLPETVSFLAGLARMPFPRCSAAPVLTLLVAALASLLLWLAAARAPRRA